MTKSIIDAIGREKALKLMGDAIQKDMDRRAALGLPEVAKIDGVVSYCYPDGFVEPVGDGRPTPRLLEIQNRIASCAA